MIGKVRETIEKYELADSQDSMLCCLSGGADSVALLICLHELGYNVSACHVNHNMRGEESDRDEMFCRKLCGKLGIPISVYSIDVRGYAAAHKTGTEQSARIMRYEIFEKCGCDRICTAHTLSDSLETLLFNLARGTGTKGLASIPVKRGNVIRPLIECSRVEVEDFLRSRGQDWVTDSTNLTDEYARNKIRHNVVPALKEINPAVEKTLIKTLENLREDSAFIESRAQSFFISAQKDGGLDAQMLTSSPFAISGRAIRYLCEAHGHDCTRKTALEILHICQENGGKLTLGNGLYAVCKKGLLYIEKAYEAIPYTEVLTCGEGEYTFLDKSVKLEIAANCEDIAKIHKKSTYLLLDYDKIKGSIVIRNRKAGDKIKFSGRQHTTDLRKLMQSRLPHDKRASCVLLSDSEGVIAAESFGIADRVKCGGMTKNVLICKISCGCHNKGI